MAVVVLAWNNRADTEACLASLERMDYPDLRVVLADNGSTDGTVAAVRAAFPRVTVVENGSNLGFAEGNNAGIRIALAQGAEFVLLLNNDTVVDTALVRTLVDAHGRLPHAGFLGPRIYYATEPRRVWMGAPVWDGGECRYRHVGRYEEEPAEPRECLEVGYVCGCALFFHRGVVDKLGLMEPRFFCYFEEADWCWRGRRAGLRSYYVPTARVWHKVSATAGGRDSPLRRYYRTRNVMLWAERNLSFGPWLRIAGRTLAEGPRSVTWRGEGWVGTARRWVWSLRQLCEDPSLKAWRWGIRDYVLRRFGRAPAALEQKGTKGS